MSRVGAFVKGSLILVVSNIALKAINFILLPLYTHYLTPALLGVTDTIVNFTALFFSLLVLALDSAFGAFYYDEDSQLYQDKVFNTVWVILLCTSGLSFLVMAFSPALSVLLFGESSYALAICLSLAAVALNVWHVPFALRARLQNRMALFGLVSIVSSLCMILSNVLLLSVFHLGYYAMILSTLVSHAVQILLYVILSGPPISIRLFDGKLLCSMLRYSIPLLPITLANWVITLSDRYILLFCGYSEADVGLYGVAARFVNILSVLTSAVFAAYPAFAYQSRRDDESRLFPKVLNVFFLLLSGVCFFIAMFGREIIALMTTPGYHPAYRLLPELMFAQLAYGLSVLVGYGIAFAKKSVFSALSMWIGAIINVVTNLMFIPRFGLTAAVITTLISYCVMLVFNYVFAQRLYPCRYEVFRIVPVFAGLYAVSVLSETAALPIKILLWLMSMAACLAVFHRNVAELLQKLRQKLAGKA